MLRLFVVCLIALAVAIGLSMLVMRDQGYILISYANWSIEANLWAALAALVLVLLLGYFLLRLLLQIRYSGQSLQHWLQGRDARRSEALLTTGLIEYIEGNWKRSLKTFTKGAEKSPTPLLNYLMAARASEALGDEEECQQYLRKARDTTPGADVAIGLTQAEIQLSNKHYAECLITLKRVRELAPDHPLALNMLVTIHQHLGHWNELKLLLPQLRKQKVFESDEFDQLELSVYKGLLAAPVTDAEQLQTISAHWEDMPKALKKEATLVGMYAHALINGGADYEAEKLLSTQLQKEWNIDLVRLYGTVRAEDTGKQLGNAEAWLEEHPEDPNLLLTLGRLSLMNELWGKAREYFAASINFKPNAEAYGELGRLLAHLGEPQQSNENFQQGLLLSTRGLPKLPLPNREISF